MARVYLADCQPLFNEALQALIERDGRHDVVGSGSTAAQVTSAVARLEPDLVLVDAELALVARPPLVEEILGRDPTTKVLVLAQEMDLELLLGAVRSGAVGVVGKKSGTRIRRLLDLGERNADSPLNRLSPREREVLALLGRGWNNARIGRELFISPHTVRTHVQNILQKLEMHSKLEAATFAMQRDVAPRRLAVDNSGTNNGSGGLAG